MPLSACLILLGLLCMLIGLGERYGLRVWASLREDPAFLTAVAMLAAGTGTGAAVAAVTAAGVALISGR